MTPTRDQNRALLSLSGRICFRVGSFVWLPSLLQVHAPNRRFMHADTFLGYSELADSFAVFKANTRLYSRFYSVSSREGRRGPGRPSAVKAPGLTWPVVALPAPAAEATRARPVREPAAASHVASAHQPPCCSRSDRSPLIGSGRCSSLRSLETITGWKNSMFHIIRFITCILC